MHQIESSIYKLNPNKCTPSAPAFYNVSTLDMHCRLPTQCSERLSHSKGLVTNYGEGGYNTGVGGGGGQVKFYPYEKGGRQKKF